jgi:hypothetical protein
MISSLFAFRAAGPLKCYGARIFSPFDCVGFKRSPLLMFAIATANYIGSF